MGDEIRVGGLVAFGKLTELNNELAGVRSRGEATKIFVFSRPSLAFLLSRNCIHLQGSKPPTLSLSKATQIFIAVFMLPTY